MRRIILVNQVAGPMFIDLANYYVDSGLHVCLLTGIVEKTGQTLSSSVEIIKLTKYNRSNPLLRIITWLFFYFRAYMTLKRVKDESEVLLVSNPPLLPLLSYFLRNKQTLRFRILIYDIYPDILIRSGFLSKKSFIARWWSKKNEQAFKQALKLFTISEEMKNVLGQYAPSGRWEVIYPWVDTTFIKPIPKEENPFVKHHKLQDKTIVLYSGNMGVSHNLLPVLHVAKKLDGVSDYFFLFIGEGAEKKRLLAYTKENALGNTQFLPFQDTQTLPFSLTAADIGIVTLSDAATQMSVPSKTFYQMAAGNAIMCIANKNAELSKIVLDNNCGMVFPVDSVNEIAQYLLNLDKSELKRFGENSRIASKKFTKSNVQQFNL
ncbi:glycosyltransferase family 4 protein [Bacteroidota bacterium]